MAPEIALLPGGRVLELAITCSVCAVELCYVMLRKLLPNYWRQNASSG
jgi:hypothetical protein